MADSGERGKARLKRYAQKRNFKKTAEPSEKARSTRGASGKTQQLIFVIQKHAASHLHWDFRLEWQGTLRSWAVPKGPSLDPRDKRLAVEVEDHPIAYASFHGEIPAGQYGAGQVYIWDHGTWSPIGDPRKSLRAGKLEFVLHGEKLTGRFKLVRMHGDEAKKPQWLLIK